MIILLMIIIVTTITFIFHWKYFREGDLEIAEFLLVEFLSLLVGAMIGTIVWVIPYGIINSNSTDVNYVEIARYELLPITDNTYYTKKDIPRSDSLDISFSYRHPQLGIMQNELTIRRDKYFYDYIPANETPYMAKKQIQHPNYLINFLFGPFKQRYVFYIPEGATP